jgi:hypothetical protein
MKKLITLSSVALALLTASCSNDTVLEEKTEALVPIGFNAAVTKTTRATDLTKDNLEKFYVYGYTRENGATSTDEDNSYGWSTVFNNEEVTKKDGSYKYTNTQYWRHSYDYHFYAICAKKNGSSNSDSDDDDYVNPKFEPVYSQVESQNDFAPTSAKITFTNIDDSDRDPISDGEYDLIYAYGTVKNVDSNSPTSVGLEFKHLLSRVKFKFVGDANNPSSYTVNVCANITNTYKSGTFQIKDGSVESCEGDDDGDSLSFDQKSFSGSGSAETNEKFIIPADYALKANVLFDLTTNDKQSYTNDKTITLPQVEMKSGYSYVYTINVKLSDVFDEIKFSVASVESYKDGETITGSTAE